MGKKKYSERYLEVIDWITKRESAHCLWQTTWDKQRNLLLDAWQLGRSYVLVLETQHGVEVFFQTEGIGMASIVSELEKVEARR